MKCPRCHDVDLVEGGALSASTCERCGGGLVPESGLALLLEEIKSTRDELKDIAQQYGGERIQCPSCRSKMSPLVLRGERVDLCFGCGSLWFDAGELEVVSQGRHALPAATKPAPVKALATTVPAQALVRIDERTLARHVVRAVLAGTGAVGVVWSLVGIVPGSSAFLGVAALAVSAVLSRREAFDVLPRARRIVRWRGYFAPSAKDNVGDVFSPDSCVVVRRLRVGGRVLPWVAIDLVDGEGRQLVRLKGPLFGMTAWTEAPRYARALGVSVRFDVDAAADDALDADPEPQPDAPAFAKAELLRIEPERTVGKVRRLELKAADGTALGSVQTEISLKGSPKNLDELLAEHFVLTDVTGQTVRLFSTTQLGSRATVLVGREGRVLGHVWVKRGPLSDTFGFAGPQARRAATATLRHGTQQARVVDTYGRGAGMLEVAIGPPGEPRKVSLHLFPGRLTGEARWALFALAVHASLVSAVPEV